jgi:hypothetical protein
LGQSGSVQKLNDWSDVLQAVPVLLGLAPAFAEQALGLALV